ncbi:unnamed protein product, partial [Hapterophycus canaliculatus]
GFSWWVKNLDGRAGAVVFKSECCVLCQGGRNRRQVGTGFAVTVVPGPLEVSRDLPWDHAWWERSRSKEGICVRMWSSSCWLKQWDYLPRCHRELEEEEHQSGELREEPVQRRCSLR